MHSKPDGVRPSTSQGGETDGIEGEVSGCWRDSGDDFLPNAELDAPTPVAYFQEKDAEKVSLVESR